MIDITEHLGLAQRIAWNFYPKIRAKYEFEDVLQVAYVGLTKAGRDFDGSRGLKFSTYAFAIIKGEVIRFISDDKRYNMSRGVPHNLAMISYEFEYENGCLQNMIGVDGFEDSFIVRAEINNAVNQLSQREKQVMKMYYINDLHQGEIAKIMHTSQSQISRMKIRISKKLKLALKDTYSKKVAM